MKKFTLLDCTLRDGGYYNNWDFPNELIEDYLKAMAAAKIEFVELGFRFYKKDIYLGPCAYTTLFFLGNVVSIRYMFYICVQQRNKIFDSFALIASIHFTKYKHV